jgi:iron complex outermembrane recepter protein
MKSPGSKFHLSLMTSASALLVLGVPVCAHAQDNTATETAQSLSDVIIVTARKKEESLQEVPVSISVFNEAAITELQIDSVKDVARLSPGFQLTSSSFGRIDPSPGMRGIRQNGGGDEPTVAFFIDGIYVDGRALGDQFLTDLERVEVIKGPQSALFGQNSFGGAVNYITKKPSSSFEGHAEFTAGTKDLYEGKASISGPITSSLRGHIGLFKRDQGALFTNSNASGPENIGAEDVFAVNAALNWEPGDGDFRVDLRVIYQDEDYGQGAAFIVDANCLSSAVAPAINYRYFCGKLPARDASNAAGDVSFDYGSGLKREQLRLSGVVAYDVGGVTIKSTTGYNDVRHRASLESDYLTFSGGTGGQFLEDESRKGFSQDFNLSSNGDGSVSWSLGAFYYWSRFNEAGDTSTLRAATLDVSQRNDQTVRTENKSIYGSVDWALTDALTLSLEGRFLHEKKDWLFIDRSTTRGVFVQRTEMRALAVEKFIPRIIAAYAIDQDNNVYTSYAEGFKSGGFNSNVNIFNSERVYEPERNKTYEIGYKTTFGRGLGYLNVTAFYVDWTNAQIIAPSAAGASNNTYLTNASAVESKGVELQLGLKPVKGLFLSLGYAFADATFVEYRELDLNNIVAAGNLATNDVSGNLVPRHSKHHFAGTFKYDFLDRFFIGGDYSYQSRQYSTASRTAFVGGKHDLNLRAGMNVTDDFKITVWGRNITGDDTPESGIRYFNASKAFARAWSVSPRAPATYGVTAALKF